MKSLLLEAITVAGFNRNAKNKKKNLKNKYNPKTLEKKYGSNMEYKMNTIEKNQAKNLVKSIKENRPEYFKQFDELTFDNISGPVSMNEAHITITGTNTGLQRSLNLLNGYSSIEDELNYRVVPKEEFTHSNMTPNTSKRDYSIDDSRATRKLEAFTGVNEHFVPKQEKYPLFEPMKNLTYVNGMPVFTDYLDDRYLASNKNNNGNLPFQSNVLIKPGVDGKNQDGARNNSVYRVLPRNTDAIRGEHNLKISYTNKPLVTIKKGEYRGPDFNLTKYKLPDFRETNFGDLVANKAEVVGPKQTGTYTNVSSQRNEADTYYATPAVNTNKGSGPSKSKTQFEDAKKQNYYNDMAHGFGSVEVRPVFLNEQSYPNRDNQRTTSNYSQSGAVHLATGADGSYINDVNYIPLPTIRDSTSHNIILGSKPEGGNTNTLPTDLAKKTIRQTTSHDLVLGSKPENQGGAVYQNDKAKKTIRETTSHNKILGAQPENRLATLQLTDKAKITIKETTSHQMILGAQPEYSGVAYYQTDDAKRTIRETTSHNKILGAQPEYSGVAYYQTDDAKRTIRETTSHNKILGAQPEYSSGNVQPTDKAKITIRETTSHNLVLGSKPEYSTGIVQPTDKAKKTIKQTTSHNLVLGSKPENASGIVQPTDKAKNTVRQTTLFTTPGMNVANIVTNGYTKDDKDKAKPTIRQTTENTQQNEGPAGGVDNYSGYTRDEKDQAKPTIRQTTENTQQNEGPAGGVDNYSGYARDVNDRAKVTVRQTTLLTDYIGQMSTEVQQPTSYLSAENMTMRETREIGNYNRTSAGGANLAGPQLNNATVKMNCKKTSVYYVPHPHVALDNNIFPSEPKHKYENKKPVLDYGDYYINNCYINTLSDNPYVNDIYHQKNTKF